MSNADRTGAKWTGWALPVIESLISLVIAAAVYLVGWYVGFF